MPRKDDLLPDSLLEAVDKAKGIKNVNKELVKTAYKDAVKIDENLSTLRLKIWLLSRQGDWVEVGTWGFSFDKVEQIADFVRDIVLNQLEDIESFIINGTITVRYAVIDETTDEVTLKNTIKIAVPKDLIKKTVEVKREIVKEKVEEGIWEGLGKFIELNKQILDTAIQAKEIEKESLINLLKAQLEAVNQKMQELQQKLLQAKQGDDNSQLQVLMQFVLELQRIRDEYEKRLFELITMQQQQPKEVKKDETTELLKTLLDRVLNKEDRTPDEITKFTYSILKEVVETALKKEEKDPVKELKEVANLLKELKDKDTGEDIKDQLSQAVLEITKKKIAEDPLEDISKKVKLLKEVLKEISGDQEKEELRREIEQLKNLILSMQMQNEPLLPTEEEKDPLEKLERETERLAKIYERMEKLFGRREPASKTFLETIKEVLSSPTIVELGKIFVQALIQSEQLKAQQMAMMPMVPAVPYTGYGYMPTPQPQPRVKKRVVRRPVINTSPLSQVKQQVVPPKVNIQQPQPQPQPVGPNIQEQPQSIQNPSPQQNLQGKLEAIVKKELEPVLSDWKEKGKRGGARVLKAQLVKKIVEIEKQTRILQRIFESGNTQLLLSFKGYVDTLLEQAGFSKEEADKLVEEIIQETMKKLAQEG